MSDGSIYGVLIASWFLCLYLIRNKIRPEDREQAYRCYQEGWGLRYGGELELALNQFQFAIELDKDSLKYHLTLIEFLLELEHLDEAESVVNSCLWRFPFNDQVNRLKSIISFRLNKSELSIKYYCRYMKQRGDDLSCSEDEIIILQTRKK